MRRWCEPYQSQEHGVYTTNITDVVETCTRDSRDVIGEGKMRIKMTPRLRAETVGGTD